MYTDQLQKANERRQQLAAQIRELADRQDDWTAEDISNWEKVNADYDANYDELQALEGKQRNAARAAEIAEQVERERVETATEIGEFRRHKSGAPTEQHRADALQAWFRAGRGLSLENRHEEACAMTGFDAYRTEFDARVFFASHRHGQQIWHGQAGPILPQREERNLSVGTDASGGFTVPSGFIFELERVMTAFGGPRQVARIMSTADGISLSWPVCDDTSNTGELLAEAGSIGSSVDPTFSSVTLSAYKYSSKAVRTSSELLADSAFNLANEIASLLGERLGRIQATHYTTGDASSKPEGLTVGGTPAAKTAASASAITANELIDLQETLDAAYQGLPSVGWMFEQATRKAIRQLVDGNSQYLWQPGLRAGEPDLLLGKPYTVNEDMPSITNSAVSVLYGAFEKYVIRDAGPARFVRLNELYAGTDEVGFIAFSRHDGQFLVDKAIRGLTQAA